MSISWKQVPPEFVYDKDNVYASLYGEIKIDEKVMNGYDGPAGKIGKYTILRINKKTCYIHRLVFYAHSSLPVHTLQNGRVIFKNTENIVVDGYYRNWFEDLLFEKSKDEFVILDTNIYEKQAIHPVYGSYKVGFWYPVCYRDKKENTIHKNDTYQICILNNQQYPCIIKNITNNRIKQYHFNTGLDGYLSLSERKKSTNYLLTHIMLASVFPSIPADKNVDHIDNNPLNHLLSNLQWITIHNNSLKGQLKTASIRIERIANKQEDLLDGEEWKSLPISEYTKTLYEISNKGRIKKRTTGISLGSRIRGKKYRYTTIAVAEKMYKKYYIHQLVYLTFNGNIPDGSIILHDDKIPQNADGTYRNWAVDLRIGNRIENGTEYHEEKRKRIAV